MISGSKLGLIVSYIYPFVYLLSQKVSAVCRRAFRFFWGIGRPTQTVVIVWHMLSTSIVKMSNGNWLGLSRSSQKGLVGKSERR